MIQKHFEQSSHGQVTDQRYETLNKDYEEKLKVARKYANMDELTQLILNELIDSIVIHNAGGICSKNRTQKEEINY